MCGNDVDPDFNRVKDHVINEKTKTMFESQLLIHT